MTSAAPPSAVVAIPAHNEASHIQECLNSVATSAALAVQTRVLDRVAVVVVAHRCHDGTASRAVRTLARHVETLAAYEVVSHPQRADVGEVRSLAVERGLSRLHTHPADIWVFSTDADTVVGPTWMSTGIAEAERRGAVATLGMTTLDLWHGSEAARGIYDSIIEEGLLVEPDGSDGHTHVYGANLLVRADAYLAVGGFPRRGHGEDQRLAEALTAGGYRTARSRDWTVATSGRTVGRAHNGLASMLHHLDELDRTPARVWAEATTA